MTVAGDRIASSESGLGPEGARVAHINLCARLEIARWLDRAVLYTNFLGELRKVGLSVREFAQLVGMNPNSISNYARAGEVPTHIALIAVLVVGVGELGGDYREIMARVERVRKKPRGAGRRGRFGGAKVG